LCRYVTDTYDIAEESIQRSIDGNTYGERQTIEVTVMEGERVVEIKDEVVIWQNLK
jgi:hypothetical protein